MPSLRQYRDRIVSVKSTRKITSAMKMVAASKLKKAQDQAHAAQPYADAMGAMLARLAVSVPAGAQVSKLLSGTGSDQVHLLVLMTSDRGLCGGFNANLLRFARAEIRALKAQGKTVKLLCVGRKARDILKREFGSIMVGDFTGIGGRGLVAYSEAAGVADKILSLFEAGEFDACTVIYNRFLSVLAQKPTLLPLIPFSAPGVAVNDNGMTADNTPYEFEPDQESILAALLPRNVTVQVYRALLDSAAGEHAARMTAMDNSTRNAGDMIKNLSLQYNRARQAHITKELIEIISGAEAV